MSHREVTRARVARLGAGALVLAMALFGAGCGKNAAGTAPGGSASARGSDAPAEMRVVSIGGTMTETVFALGMGSRVVAVDTSSVYPPDAVGKLPKVGYQRTLAAEGVMRERPSLLLLSAEAGPPATIEQLKGMGVAMRTVPADATVEGAKQKIRQIAEALNATARGEEMVKELGAEMDRATALVGRATSKPRVLFIYARGAGTLMVGGAHTPSAEMIRLAGGENAVEGFDGFKPLTAEAVTAAKPDVILIPALGLESVGGLAGLTSQPGIALTPAGKAGRVVAMDDLLLLGFGPRLGQAVRELATRIHPELADNKP
ncbi:Periplasmic hemin-binding protein [Minicystis rosea]|nr:Periplasmic hemin-binding protein [Minicystis rosea]